MRHYDSVKPKVIAPGMYAIDVEPLFPHCRNKREVHLDYLKHLQKSVTTLCEIVEEAKAERPLDRSLASAFLYTKHSQELLEYVIGTCLKDFNKQHKKHVSTHLTRKKQAISASMQSAITLLTNRNPTKIRDPPFQTLHLHLFSNVAPYVPPTNKELKILFQSMFDEYLEPPGVERPVSLAPAVIVLVNSAGTPSSTIIDQDAPSLSHSPSSSALQSPSSQQGVTAGSTIIEDNPFAPIDNDPFVNVFAPEPSSKASSSEDVSSEESTHVTQPHHHLRKWIKDHPLDNVIGNPSLPVSTRKQLATDAL
nr:integrase, catalytic region, zinc finger, CCHC-type, peptidase aspartic, catalytic [Tanacetum cinerariifolium]